jgi:hypothetical protein
MLKPRPFGKNYAPKISPEALNEVQNDLVGYCAVGDATTLSEVSKGMYIDFADKFVRWLSGDFAPGEVKDGIPERRATTVIKCPIRSIM